MCGCRLHSAPPLAASPLAPPLPLAATLPAEIRGSREGWAKRVYCKGLVTRSRIFIRFSSLVIICFVKSFYELTHRFFGPAVSPCAASKRSNCERTITSCRVRWPRGNAATVATLQLASSHAGGASGLAFRHLQHALFRRARARSCHAQ